MSYTMTHLLVSEQWTVKIKPDGSGGLATVLPANGAQCETATHLVFEGRVLPLEGSPTTAEWGMVPQYGVAHTTGYQRQRPGWTDVSPADLGITVIGASIDLTGTPRIVMADHTTPMRTFQIRVPVEHLGRFRFRHLIPYTGAMPSVRCSMTMIERGESL